MKKQYIFPSLELLAVHHTSSLCSGSGISDTINGQNTSGGSEGGARAPEL